MQARYCLQSYEKIIETNILPNGKPRDYLTLIKIMTYQYSIAKKNIFTQINFGNQPLVLNNLLHIDKNNGSDTHPWKIDICESTPLGSGGYGGVYEIIGQIKVNAALAISYKKVDNKILKIKHVKDSLDIVKSEIEILHKLPHLRFNSLSFNFVNDAPILKMRLFPGTTLHTFIDSDARRKLTTTGKLIWVIELLKALKTQLHDRGVIHRDIKPANIIVNNISGTIPNIFIIDTDSCVLKNAIANNDIGTYRYRPPEGFSTTENKSLQSKQIDHFSMMMTIVDFLARTETDFKYNNKCSANIDYQESYGHCCNCEQCNADKRIELFHTTIKNGLAKQLPHIHERSSLANHIISVLKSPADKRPTLKESIAVFENCLFKHQLKSLPKDLHSDFQTAYVFGKLACKKLKKIDDCLSIPSIVLMHLYPLRDSRPVIEKYVYTLGIKALYPFNTKAAIKDFIEHTFNTYQWTNDFWLEEQLSTPYLACHQIKKIQAHHQKYSTIARASSWTLDLVDELNKKNERYFASLCQKLPSLVFKMELSSLFATHNYLNLTNETLRKEVEEWLNEEHGQIYTEKLKVFYLHYKLLSDLSIYGIDDNFFNQVLILKAESVEDFVAAVKDLKTISTRKTNNSLNFFTASPQTKLDTILNYILDLVSKRKLDSVDEEESEYHYSC